MFALHFDRRFRPMRDDQDFVRLLGRGLEIGKAFDSPRRGVEGEGGEQTNEQDVFHRNLVDEAVTS